MQQTNFNVPGIFLCISSAFCSTVCLFFITTVNFTICFPLLNSDVVSQTVPLSCYSQSHSDCVADKIFSQTLNHQPAVGMHSTVVSVWNRQR